MFYKTTACDFDKNLKRLIQTGFFKLEKGKRSNESMQKVQNAAWYGTTVKYYRLFNALLTAISGVNFTNILRAAFMRKDPKSAKKLLNLTFFFALLGSAHVKDACKMLVKLTPDVKRTKNVTAL